MTSAQSAKPELIYGLRKVTEDAAKAAFDWIGRGDKERGDGAAVDAMRTALNEVAMQGRIVIGEGERDEAPMLYIGEEVGTGSGQAIDIALDPLEGTTLTAKAMPNALAVLAIAPRGGLCAGLAPRNARGRSRARGESAATGRHRDGERSG